MFQKAESDFLAVYQQGTENPVAYIDTLTARVLYLSDTIDETTAKAIKEKVAEIKNLFPFKFRNEHKTMTIYYPTAIGEVVVELERGDVTGSKDAVFVGLHPSGMEDSYIDLTGVTIDNDAVNLMLFGNPENSDPSAYGSLSLDEIEEALEPYYEAG